MKTIGALGCALLFALPATAGTATPPTKNEPAPAASGAVPAPAPAPTRQLKIAVAQRKGGDLVVPAQPVASNRGFEPRMRTHTDGSLSKGSRRTWVGPAVPAALPLLDGTRELFLLDPLPEGAHLAIYRDPYGAATCTLGGRANCGVTARLVDSEGVPVWSLDLMTLYSRPDALEVQDIRLKDGVLYFNEGCQSYSSQAKGDCSRLVAVDPVKGAVLWRSKPLVSNHRLWVGERYIVTGYGFTNEPDYVHVVERATGRVKVRRWVKTAPEAYAVDGDTLTVSLYGDTTLRFRMVGFDGARPRLVKLKGR